MHNTFITIYEDGEKKSDPLKGPQTKQCNRLYANHFYLLNVIY